MNPNTLLQQLPETVPPDVRDRISTLLSEIENAKTDIGYYQNLIPAIEREIKQIIAPFQNSAAKRSSYDNEI